jgi:hypothetical protein
MRKIPRGTVLVDNTTLFGAAAAYEMWPPSAQDWQDPGKSAALRSLIDILECVIVHDGIATDSSSRAYFGGPEADADPYSVESFAEMVNSEIRKHKKTKAPFIENFLFGRDYYGIALLSALTSLKAVQEYIADGTFSQLAHHFEEFGGVVPSFYKGGAEFIDLFLPTIPLLQEKALKAASDDVAVLGTGIAASAPIGDLPTLTKNYDDFSDSDYHYDATLHETTVGDLSLSKDIYQQIESLQATIAKLPEGDQSPSVNYAMFSFRGLYYQTLAQLSSCSYRPHPWRSEIIDRLITDRPIGFAEVVKKSLGSARADIARKLDLEFKSPSFSYELPVFASHIVRHCFRRSELFKVAGEIRDSAEAVALRSWISGVQRRITDQSDLGEIKTALAALEKISVNVRRKYGLEETKFKEIGKVRLMIPTLSVEAPVKLPANLPYWLKTMFTRKTHIVWLKELSEQSVNLPTFAVGYHRLLN